MQLSIRLTTQPARTWPRVIIVIVIVLAAARWAPEAALPLGLGGWLGTYLGIQQPGRVAQTGRQ
jgi:hypothetical protein